MFVEVLALQIISKIQLLRNVHNAIVIVRNALEVQLKSVRNVNLLNISMVI